MQKYDNYLLRYSHVLFSHFYGVKFCRRGLLTNPQGRHCFTDTLVSKTGFGDKRDCMIRSTDIFVGGYSAIETRVST